MVAQAIVHEFCQSGALQRSIETVRTNLKARVDALVTALERDLPDARFVAPEGGYFMWVELPEGTDVDRLFAAAGERGVTFVKGSDFLLEGGQNTLRLAYSGVTPGADRRRHRPPRRGLQQPERHPGRGVAQRVEEVGDDVVGPLVDLALAVAPDDVAVGAQPQVAVAVDVGLVGRSCWRAVELDDDALLAPQAVDRPRPDGALRSGSSMPWRMRSSRKRRSSWLLVSPWPGTWAPSARRGGWRCPGARGAACARRRRDAGRGGTRLPRGRAAGRGGS